MAANRKRGIVAALGVVALLLLAACSSTGAEVAAKIKDNLQKAGVVVTSISCDQKSAKKGDKFNCNATVDGSTKLTYKITMTEDDRFSAQTAEAAVTKQELESKLAEEGKAATGLDGTVDCGSRSVYTAALIPQASCVGKIGAVTVPLTVTLGDDGLPHATPAKPLVVKAKVEPDLVDRIAKAQNIAPSDVQVDCGPAPVKVLDDSSATFTCQAKASDGSTATITAKIAADGSTEVVSAG